MIQCLIISIIENMVEVGGGCASVQLLNDCYCYFFMMEEEEEEEEEDSKFLTR